MSNATAEPPPAPFPGLVVDHSQDNASYQANIIACSVLTWAGALLFVGARFYTRRLLLRVWSWEDWAIVASLLVSALCSVTIIIRWSRSPCRQAAWLTASQKRAWAWGRISGPSRPSR